LEGLGPVTAISKLYPSTTKEYRKNGIF